jgi:heptosyltransferase-1
LNRKEKLEIDPSALKKILLIRLRRIGDVVMTTPAVAALKRALPRAALTYVIEEPLRRLVEGNPDLDRVIAVPAGQDAAGFLGLIRKIRREKYDAVLDFHGGPRASRIAWLSGAKIKVGYTLKYKGFIYDIRVPRSRPEGRIHSVKNHLNLVRTLGLRVEEPLPSLSLPPGREEEREKIDRFWTENELAAAGLIVLHIGAGNEFRDWGTENFSSLADLLTRQAGAKVVLVGAEEDRQRAAEIRHASVSSVLSLAGKLNLIELRDLIARADVFVGPDSGPMHIAASTMTPIVALFGPTLPANFAPWRAESTLIEKDLGCRPCRQRRCVTRDFRCLRTITPAEVLAACLKYPFT